MVERIMDMNNFTDSKRSSAKMIHDITSTNTFIFVKIPGIQSKPWNKEITLAWLKTGEPRLNPERDHI